MEKIKIAVIDDTKANRDIIRLHFSTLNKYEIIKESATPTEFKKFLKATSVYPDVVVLDIGFTLVSNSQQNGNSSREGLDYLRELWDQKPNIKVIMLTYHNDKKSYVIEAYIKGASGYISKADGFHFDLKKAIESVCRKNNPQGFYTSPDIPLEWVEEAKRELRKPEKTIEDLLTDSQKRVFLGIAKGLTRKEILKQKACSPGAFDAHTSQIRRQLNLDHNWEIPVYAVRNKVNGVIHYYSQRYGVEIS